MLVSKRLHRIRKILQEAITYTTPTITEKEIITTSEDVFLEFEEQSIRNSEVIMSATQDNAKGITKKEIIEKIITGTVSSAEDGLPLIGASIIVKGTTRGAQADVDGKYSIVAELGETLEYSYVGMKTQQIKIDRKSTRL